MDEVLRLREVVTCSRSQVRGGEIWRSGSQDQQGWTTHTLISNWLLFGGHISAEGHPSQEYESRD